MVETSELLLALSARGQLLLAGDAEPDDDGTKDRGLTLLALERLLALASSAEAAAASEPAAASFKAKSSRW
jgi:hypothetical protein